VARAPICKYENHKRHPKMRSLAKIAAAFDAKPSELLDDAGL
jgi:transcriptional regulator with XRE-family HTH domain